MFPLLIKQMPVLASNELTIDVEGARPNIKVETHEGECMENLRELLIEELKDLYSAEKQIVKALRKIIRGAASQEPA